ncbi:MAG TPA: hypothetical protein VKK31_28230 [Thermoanaerobaculia bacterium]|nr:hypothetical protein [Thermoanaerobaculia bacterium]
MAKNRMRRDVRKWERLMAKAQQHEERIPGLAPYRKAIQEFLDQVKPSKTRRRESDPAPDDHDGG